MSARRSIADLSADLAGRAESFCRQCFPEGRKQDNYWQVGNTSGTKGKSLAIRLQAEGGRKAGSWTDLPPFGPSFITRVCGFDLDNHGFRFGQARRARSPQIAQALGALAVA
ncbi:hypothetical protein AB9K34_05855, partial [Sedimentitalea sp. XS_ASV28]